MCRVSRPSIKTTDPLYSRKNQALEVCYDLGYLPQTVSRIAEAVKDSTINQALCQARMSDEIGMWSWGL